MTISFAAEIVIDHARTLRHDRAVLTRRLSELSPIEGRLRVGPISFWEPTQPQPQRSTASFGPDTA